MGKKLRGISINKVENGYILAVSLGAVCTDAFSGSGNYEYTPFFEEEKYIYTDAKSVIAKITEILEKQ